MIGLDTNILVRFLTQDDPAQSRIANDIMLRRLSPETPGFITLVALAETVWVLERTYGYPRSSIVSVVEQMLATDNLVVEREEDVERALAGVGETPASFTDALIGALAAGAGCSVTLTFDRRAARLPGFERV